MIFEKEMTAVGMIDSKWTNKNWRGVADGHQRIGDRH